VEAGNRRQNVRSADAARLSHSASSLVYSTGTTGAVVSWEPRDLYVFVMLWPVWSMTYRGGCFATAAPGHGAQNCFRHDDLAQVRRRIDVVSGHGWGLTGPTPQGGIEGNHRGQARKTFDGTARPSIDGDLLRSFPDLAVSSGQVRRKHHIKGFWAPKRAMEIGGNPGTDRLVRPRGVEQADAGTELPFPGRRGGRLVTGWLDVQSTRDARVCGPWGWLAGSWGRSRATPPGGAPSGDALFRHPRRSPVAAGDTVSRCKRIT